ncbi:MAG: methyltransferase domain-containing protein [Candidatus Binataceae bacterium]
MNPIMCRPENSRDRIPAWAWPLLVCPRCRKPLPGTPGEELICSGCGPAGKIEEGILRFAVTGKDASIEWYRDKGGARFFERRQEPFAMSSLDAPLYHHYLAALRPRRTGAVVLDVGAGDGRNTAPWLEWGFERVIATDAVFAALARFRERIQAEHSEWLDRIVLIECDARRLPLCDEAAAVIFAIETLYYLNEDYPLALEECRRVLKPKGRLLLSERSWEGALLTRLFYGGVEGILSLADGRDMWDGSGDKMVRSRCFTEPELMEMVRAHGLTPLESKGQPLLSLVLGYLRGAGKLKAGDEELLPQVRALLQRLGDGGRMRRTHVVVAGKSLTHG